MGISTHILDINFGRPAANVPVNLSQFRADAVGGGRWHQIGSGLTDRDGRCKTLLGEHSLLAADYKLHFEVWRYFDDLHIPTLYPHVEIVFRITDPSQHYHIPLLLTANGYTTYRGS